MTTSVLIGSRPSIPATTVQVTANAIQENLTFATGDKYLYHSTASLSLLADVATMLDTHSELAGSTAFLSVSGRVRMANAVAFTVDSWGADTTLRDLLAYTGTLGSSTAHVAPTVSPLYWAAGKRVSTRARMGSDGVVAKDTRASRSAPGRVTATTNNTWFRNELKWGFIKIDRYSTNPEVNGTWATFWDVVLSRYRRFWVARNVVEDLTDTTTAMTLTTRIPSVLPYIWKKDGPVEREHIREIARLEIYGRVTEPVETASEYS